MANKGVYLIGLLSMTTAWAQLNPNALHVPILMPGITLSGPPARHLVLGVGGEGPNACVVLLDRSPRVPGAQIGQAGLVLCCDDRDCAGMILVHWFFFTSGVHDTRNCVDGAPLSIPMQSATWINPREVALGVCFDTCGILRRGNSGCALFETDSGLTYNLVDVEMLSSPVGPMGEFDFGDRVRVQGLLQISGPRTRFANLCAGQDADIHSAVLSRCAPA